MPGLLGSGIAGLNIWTPKLYGTNLLGNRTLRIFRQTNVDNCGRHHDTIHEKFSHEFQTLNKKPYIQILINFDTEILT